MLHLEFCVTAFAGRSMKDTHKGIACAVLTMLLWSTLAVGLKLGVSRIGGFSATVHMIGIATVALLVYLLATGKAGQIMPTLRRMPVFFVGTGLIGLGLHQVLYLTGYSLLPASQVVIIHYLWPLTMVVLSAMVFRERIRALSVLFVIVGFVGLYVSVARGTLLTVDLSSGVIITFVGSFCWALFSVLIKHREFDVEVGMFLLHVFGLAFLIALIPVYGLTVDLRLGEVLGFAYLGIFPTALSYILWNRALRLAPTSVCSNIVLLVPVLSLVWIRLVLAEAVSVYQLVGFVMIMGSMFLNLRYAQTEST